MDLSDVDGSFMPISEAMRAFAEKVLKEANPDSTVTLIDFSESFRRELIESKNLGTSYTPYCMVRLFADEIEGIGDKMLYLDTDVLVKGDISELYDMEIEKYHLAGARDYIGKYFFTPLYLNSGVLLFNMKRMREDDVFKKCRELCNRKKMLLNDQHAINRYARRRLVLSRRFNEQKKSRKNTLIRHFAMTIKMTPRPHKQNIKPWQPELVMTTLKDHSFDEIFREYDELIASAVPQNAKE
jgi:lipopolysaccharide biosynthesis glycosyltransferase